MSLSITHKDFDEWMMPVYTPAPFIPMRGEGSRLWDQRGKEYIDFAGGIAVNTLGHTHPALREASNDQASRSWHVGSSYTNEPVLRLAKKPIDATFAERIFFCSPGAGASEAVLKLTHKYAHNHFGSQKSGIVTFKDVLHGRTLFTVSVGGQPTYSQGFAPLPLNIRHAVYDDLDSTNRLIDDITYAVITEPVQGEGGVVPATKAFLQELRELCDRHNTLLIFDEVRAGVGRTGELYAYMHYGVTPSLLTMTKALGGGFPIGALLTTERCVSVIAVGTYDTTYGGNPLAATVTGKLLEIVNTPEVLNEVEQRHDWFVERVNAINKRFGLFSEIRGLGLLIGCVLSAEFAGKTKLISQETTVAGVMVLIADTNVMCFTPAPNVNEEEVATRLNYFVLVCERIKTRGSP